VALHFCITEASDCMNFSGAIALATAAVMLPQVAAAGDPEYGRRLAENWCSSCHTVAPDQRSTNRGPPFARIAQSPEFSAERLSYLLLDPHPKMAKLALSQRAIDNIASYIKSLKK
jgi:mono/diheme cytochrome c family protein